VAVLDSTELDDFSFDVVDPRSDEAVNSLRSYFAELDARFEAGFDPGDTITADASQFEAPEGVFVVIRAREAATAEAVCGCGAVQLLDDGIAEIKRMWIAPSVRGNGLGRAMLDELERHALELGDGVIRLDTNNVLAEAIALYTAQGYTQIERYNDNPYARHWFEKRAAQ